MSPRFNEQLHAALHGMSTQNQRKLALQLLRQCKFACIVSYGFQEVESAIESDTLSLSERNYLIRVTASRVEQLSRQADSSKTSAQLNTLSHLASWASSREKRHLAAAFITYSKSSGNGLMESNLINQVHAVRVSS